MKRLLLTLLLTCAPVAAPGWLQAQDTAEALRFAAAQHEILSILIREGNFDSVLPEFQKILDLGLTGDAEKPLVQEAWLIAESLAEAGQYELAGEIVAGTLERVELDESKFYLLMLTGKLLQDQGLTSQALEAYRQAQDFKE